MSKNMYGGDPMSQWDREGLEELELRREGEAEKKQYTPRTPFQRTLAWIALAVVLFGLGGTIYWMMAFKP